jgi:hypothetical protein
MVFVLFVDLGLGLGLGLEGLVLVCRHPSYPFPMCNHSLTPSSCVTARMFVFAHRLNVVEGELVRTKHCTSCDQVQHIRSYADDRAQT